MKLILAHPSPVRRARLAARLRKRPGIVLLAEAADLTALYTAAEHMEPDAILLEADLARPPEFEVMRALFAALNLSCILIAETPSGQAVPLAEGLPEIEADQPPDQLEEALRSAARVKVTRLAGAPARMPGRSGAAPRAATPEVASRDGALILIGASTGGVDALIAVLRRFPRMCPPTLIVQHTGGAFAGSLIRLLDSRCEADVGAAQDGEGLRRGRVYLAPDDTAHLVLRPGVTRRAGLERAASVGNHRPSVDALFRSAVSAGQDVAAALLTGMGRDGAQGLLELSRAGATTMAQDEATSVVYGMPRVAWEIGATRRRLPIERIGPALLTACAADRRDNRPAAI